MNKDVKPSYHKVNVDLDDPNVQKFLPNYELKISPSENPKTPEPPLIEINEEVKPPPEPPKEDLPEAIKLYMSRMKEYKNRLALAYTKAFLHPMTEFRIPSLPLHQDMD